MTRTLVGCAISALAAALAVLPASVAGQERAMIVRTVVDSTDGGPAIARRTIDRWAEYLALDEEQKLAALALFEGYSEEYHAARREMTEGVSRAQADSDTSDPAEVGRRFMEARKKFSEKSQALEKVFMGDLRSLLTTEQEAAWPKVERMRRRQIVAQHSTVSGDSVDLRRAVEELNLGPDAVQEIEETLNQYELELDHAVQARLNLAQQGELVAPGRPMDFETIQKRMAEAREAGTKLRDVNQRHARRVESQLPEDRRDEFAMAVKRQSFPRIYRESTVTRHLKAALGFSDLDSDQKEALTQLSEKYERELAAANDAWAKAEEGDSSAGGSIGGSGGAMVVRFGGEDPEVAEARKNRREVDDRARERLTSILRPEQQERLPKAGPLDGDSVVPITNRVIVR